MEAIAIQVTFTCGSREEAENLARELLDRRLAACIHVSSPVVSFYRWDGAVQKDTEWLCTAKTTQERFGAIEKVILQNHSYENPEILAMPIVEGSTAYVKWLMEEVDSV